VLLLLLFTVEIRKQRERNCQVMMYFTAIVFFVSSLLLPLSLFLIPHAPYVYPEKGFPIRSWNPVKNLFLESCFMRDSIERGKFGTLSNFLTTRKWSLLHAIHTPKLLSSSAYYDHLIRSVEFKESLEKFCIWEASQQIGNGRRLLFRLIYSPLCMASLSGFLLSFAFIMWDTGRLFWKKMNSFLESNSRRRHSLKGQR